MSRSARGSRRGGGAGNARTSADAPPAAAAAPPDARSVLETVASNPALQGPHVILRGLIEQGINTIPSGGLRAYATQTLGEMLQGGGPKFSVLQGTPLEALGSLQAEGEAVVLPDTAWGAQLLSCLADISANSHAADDLPAQPDASDALLVEMTDPMSPQELQAALQQLLAYGEHSSAPVTNVANALLQLSQLEGPLRLLGTPGNADLQGFHQHLNSLSNMLNTLHDQKVLGEYLQSPHFDRSKYELFVLQHMQLLVWLQRVQTGLLGGVNKAGAEGTQFVAQIAHAARVLLFQPMVLHMLQVMRTVSSLPTEETAGSMRSAMAYPAETASDADRVEWLQLNLLLQFQTVYKDALCNIAIYEATAYSPGEQNLFAGFLRLEEIYTHLIGRFPGCCPLTEQEQAVLSQLCGKLNKFFQDGKQIKQLLEQQPQYGKQMLLQQRVPGVTSAQFAVRDWILPFMMQFTDLLKVLWTLWTQLKRKELIGATQRSAVTSIAKQVGLRIVEQLAEETAALHAAHPSTTLKGERREAVGSAAVASALSPQRLAPAAEQANGYGQARPGGGDGGGSGWAGIVRRPAQEPMPGAVAPEPRAKAAAPAALAAAKPRGAGTTDEAVRTLVSKRESARFARDFESADRLREQLSRLGVTLDDQNKVWRGADGRTGPITAVNISELHAQKAAKSGAASLSDDEIDRLVKEREQARFTSDYKTADRLRETLEKHGVHLDTKENKWQAADGRSGPIGPVNISAAHAQKAARSGAPKMALEEIEGILIMREQARARRDYKTADVYRDTLEKHGVYLDAKENKWHATDGRTGAIVMSSLSDEEVGKILASRQAARLRHDYKTADRLRDQLNEQCVSVDDKKNRWDASDVSRPYGRSGCIEPFTCVRTPLPDAGGAPAGSGSDKGDVAPAGAAAAPAAATARGEGLPPPAKGDSKRVLPEKARRELAKQLRAVTGASARQCEKALQSNADDMDRAANWLLEQSPGADGEGVTSP